MICSAKCQHGSLLVAPLLTDRCSRLFPSQNRDDIKLIWPIIRLDHCFHRKYAACLNAREQYFRQAFLTGYGATLLQHVPNKHEQVVAGCNIIMIVTRVSDWNRI